jgi:glutamate-ammonia-ligase adenylyltransferase
MALSRARLICGDESLIAEAEQIVGDVLSTKRDIAKVTHDVAEMRELVDKEKPPAGPWDLKQIPGGVIDIEFIAQYLALIAPSKGIDISVNGLSTGDALKALGDGMIGSADLDTCLQALTLYTDLSQLIRLCIDGLFDPKEAPSGLIELVCRAGDCPDIKTLEGEVKRLSKAVRKIFQSVVKL